MSAIEAGPGAIVSGREAPERVQPGTAIRNDLASGNGAYEVFPAPFVALVGDALIGLALEWVREHAPNEIYRALDIGVYFKQVGQSVSASEAGEVGAQMAGAVALYLSLGGRVGMGGEILEILR